MTSKPFITNALVRFNKTPRKTWEDMIRDTVYKPRFKIGPLWGGETLDGEIPMSYFASNSANVMILRELTGGSHERGADGVDAMRSTLEKVGVTVVHLNRTYEIPEHLVDKYGGHDPEWIAFAVERDLELDADRPNHPQRSHYLAWRRYNDLFGTPSSFK